MEGEHEVDGRSPATVSGGTPASPRWNPTKEQISELENLYKQGIRTPSADQIHEITVTLRAYGHIEAKNVFYWFQNHKARQRQKQKQETISYFNRYLRLCSSPVVFPPHPNAVRVPYYTAQSNVGFHDPPQNPKVLIPRGFTRRSRPDKILAVTTSCNGRGYDTDMTRNSGNIRKDEDEIVICSGDTHNSHNNIRTTLSLFPLHPTGFLEETRLGSDDSAMIPRSSVSSVTSDDAEGEGGGGGGGSKDQYLINFFNNGSGRG